MNPRTVFLVGLAAAAAASVAAAVWVWRRFLRWREKDPDEIERLRRLDVNRRGRIAAAEIVDLVEPEEMAPVKFASRPCMIVYKYEVAGVTYEVSQDVSALPSALAASRSLAHESASIKYDPRAPTNSIIACEEWNGIEGWRGTAKAADEVQ
jgi:hypothetical protein